MTCTQTSNLEISILVSESGASIGALVEVDDVDL